MANEVEILVTSKDKSAPGFKSAREEGEKYGKSIEGVGEKADKGEQRILGLKDSVDGVATVMQGPGKQGMAAWLQGWADIASGIANFAIPALAKFTLTNIRATASTIYSTVVQKTAAGAAKAWAAAQWLLNGALSGNPIALVIIAVAGLILVLISAYRHSETFRKIVHEALRVVGDTATWLWEKAVRPAFTSIVGLIKNVVGWFADLPKNIVRLYRNADDFLWSAGRAIVTGLSNGLRAAWTAAWAWIKGRPGAIVGIYIHADKWLYNKGRDVLLGLWGGLKAVWKDLTGWISGLTGWIKDHKGPPALDRSLLVQAGKDIMGGFFRGLKHGGLEALGFVKGVAGDIASAVGGGFTQSTSSGAMQKMVAGYASMLYGWTGSQWDALNKLLTRESGFNPTAQNPTSTARGIFQFLDSTWAGVNATKTDNPQLQTLAGLRYVKQRYGDPGAAWAHEMMFGWYDQGGWLEPGLTLAVNATGRRERIVAPGQDMPGGTARVVLEIDSAGSRLDDLLVDVLRNAIRKRGGDVQLVLGRA